VFKGRKLNTGEMYKKLMKGILEALAVRFPTERSPLINATKISNLSNWPDPGSKDITGLPSMFCYLSLFGFFLFTTVQMLC
jgi:hypothetical protein